MAVTIKYQQANSTYLSATVIHNWLERWYLVDLDELFSDPRCDPHIVRFQHGSMTQVQGPMPLDQAQPCSAGRGAIQIELKGNLRLYGSCNNPHSLQFWYLLYLDELFSNPRCDPHIVRLQHGSMTQLQCPVSVWTELNQVAPAVVQFEQTRKGHL